MSRFRIKRIDHEEGDFEAYLTPDSTYGGASEALVLRYYDDAKEFLKNCIEVDSGEYDFDYEIEEF